MNGQAEIWLSVLRYALQYDENLKEEGSMFNSSDLSYSLPAILESAIFH